MRSSRVVAWFSLIALASGLAIAAAPTAEASDLPVSNSDVVRAAGLQWNQHPGDYLGFARAVERAGGDGIRFSFPRAGLVDLSPAQAQAAADRAERDETQARTVGRVVRPATVPLNAFGVSTSWYHVRAQDGEFYNFEGSWNFRDDYIGGNQPDDASGAAVADMPTTYWRNDGDTVFAADYAGKNYSSSTYRKSASFGSSIWGLRDQTSGFKMNVDHGTHTITYKRYKSGGSLSSARGHYYYEHNQDGGGGWSASITIAVFSVSYSGSPGSKLQKGSAVDYLQ